MTAQIIYQKGQRPCVDSRLRYQFELDPHTTKQGRKVRRARYLCDCGTMCDLRTWNTARGTTKSCGCLNKEVHTRHGQGGTEMYHIWHSIMQRCHNPESFNYYNYGARGIKVCNKWHDVLAFISDMGDRPKGKQIDRIDNDGDYTPNNCRWATSKENTRNTRKSKWWHINGVTYASSTQAAKHHKVTHRTIMNWCESEKMENCYSELKYK